MAIDRVGNVLVTGRLTSQVDWISGGFETNFNGGGGYADAFLAKFSAAGAPLWSSYLGGSRDDQGIAVMVDHQGYVWVGGETYSSNWVSGGFETHMRSGVNGFVAKVFDGIIFQGPVLVTNGVIRLTFKVPTS